MCKANEYKALMFLTVSDDTVLSIEFSVPICLKNKNKNKIKFLKKSRSRKKRK